MLVVDQLGCAFCSVSPARCAGSSLTCAKRSGAQALAQRRQDFVVGLGLAGGLVGGQQLLLKLSCLG
jgi:hypothetical protein